MQFTVYRSRGRNAAFPFVIDVTSDIIGEINRRIVIPLTPIERLAVFAHQNGLTQSFYW